jgi:hypothetical protein
MGRSGDLHGPLLDNQCEDWKFDAPILNIAREAKIFQRFPKNAEKPNANQ